jgi:hypothetical protein
MRLILAVFLIASTLSACKTTGIFVIDAQGVSSEVQLSVQDSRTELSRNGGKPSLISRFYYHADAAFVPTRLALFKAALSRVHGSSSKAVVLTKFDVIDSYARRMGAAQAAALASISPAAAVGASPVPGNSDFITCTIEATIDGASFSATASAAYKENRSSANVFLDPSYQSAVHTAVQEALSSWVAQAQATPSLD